MTDETPRNKPIKKHEDGRLRAAIWANEGERGPIYNATLTYSYQDKDGNWRDTHSIPAHALLKAANLAQRAYNSVVQLKEQDRAQYVERALGESRSDPGRERPRGR